MRRHISWTTQQVTLGISFWLTKLYRAVKTKKWELRTNAFNMGSCPSRARGFVSRRFTTTRRRPRTACWKLLKLQKDWNGSIGADLGNRLFYCWGLASTSYVPRSSIFNLTLLSRRPYYLRAWHWHEIIFWLFIINRFLVSFDRERVTGKHFMRARVKISP